MKYVQGAFTIVQNQTLPTCEAERLRDLIGTSNITGALKIYGNDDAGVCP